MIAAGRWRSSRLKRALGEEPEGLGNRQGGASFIEFWASRRRRSAWRKSSSKLSISPSMRKVPQRRHERRRKREERARVEKSSPDDVSAARKQEKRSRHVPVALEDQVLERASYQCEYRGRDGALH
jgi:hypothetical protein